METRRKNRDRFFLSYECALAEEGALKKQVKTAEWSSGSPLLPPLLAVLFRSGELSVFFADGAKLSVVAESDATAFAWMPCVLTSESALLPTREEWTLCWSEARKTCHYFGTWNEAAGIKEIDYTSSHHHQGQIVKVIQFHVRGKFLVSIDNDGIAIIWKFQSKKNRLEPMCKYNDTSWSLGIAFRTKTAYGVDNYRKIVCVAVNNNGKNTVRLLDGENCKTDKYLLDHRRYEDDSTITKTTLSEHIVLLKYCHSLDRIVLATSRDVLISFGLNNEGGVCDQVKIQLASELHTAIWGSGQDGFPFFAQTWLLAALNCKGKYLTMWPVGEPDPYLLSFAAVGKNTEHPCSIAYSPKQRTLFLALPSGEILRYNNKMKDATGFSSSPSSWEELPPLMSKSAEQHNSSPFLLKVSLDGNHIAVLPLEKESDLLASVISVATDAKTAFSAAGLSVVQVAYDQVLICRIGNNTTDSNKTARAFTNSLKISGVAISQDNKILLWSAENHMEIYIVHNDQLKTTLHACFALENVNISDATLRGGTSVENSYEILIASSKGVHILDEFGKFKRMISLDEEATPPLPSTSSDGAVTKGQKTNTTSPIFLDISSGEQRFLAVAKAAGGVFLFDLSVAENSNNIYHQNLQNTSKSSRAISAVAVNSNGSVICVKVASLKASSLEFHFVSSGKVVQENASKSNMTRRRFFWEARDPRFLACEFAVKSARSDVVVFAVNCATDSVVVVDDNVTRTSIFTGAPDELLLDHDDQQEEDDLCFVGFSDGSLFFVNLLLDSSSCPSLLQKTLKNFPSAGIEMESASSLCRTLWDYTFYLATGDLEQATQCVEEQHSSADIWTLLAIAAVDSRRLDILKKCLAKTRNVVALSAMRLHENDDVKLAIGAVHLGRFEMASDILCHVGRNDLAVDMWRDLNENTKAKTIAGDDRLLLRQSEDCVHLWRRHLYSLDRIDELKLMAKTDAPTAIWLGRCLESTGDDDGASELYEIAQDFRSLTKLACRREDKAQAIALCRKLSPMLSNVKNNGVICACYLILARHLEHCGEAREAIVYYSKAGRQLHAIRLAKEAGMEELPNAGVHNNNDVVEQKAFQTRALAHVKCGEFQQAALLFSRGGNIEKAVEICLAQGFVDLLANLAEALAGNCDDDSTSRHALQAKSADFLESNGRSDASICLWAAIGLHEKAIEVCESLKDGINSDLLASLVETFLNPPKTDPNRKHLLIRLGVLCREQALYQLACKKFTQGGDKVEAVKALIKSGDSKKTIFFANTAKQADIFLLAANYLQSEDWVNDTQLSKTIVSFYTRAGEKDKLLSFYTRWTRAEIDEFKDYPKATRILKDKRQLLKTLPDNSQEEIEALSDHIAIVERFCKLREDFGSGGISLLQLEKELYALVDEPRVQEVLRLGDVYGELVERFEATGHFEDAIRVMTEMRNAGINLTSFLGKPLINRVLKGQHLEEDQCPTSPEEKEEEEEILDETEP